MTARRFAPFVLLLLVVATYIQTLDAPFVWDDHYLVLDSPMVTERQPLASYFERAFWSSPEAGDSRVYYRPLTVLSLALDYQLHGTNPAGFHLTNALLHTLNALLLYALLRRFKTGPWLALGVSAAWGLHPRLTEAAAWIAGRTDVLSATFTLLALLMYRPRQASRMLLASGLVFLSLLSKEVGLAGALALGIAELCCAPPNKLNPSTAGGPHVSRLFIAALPAVALVGYLLLRYAALSSSSAAASTLALSASERVVLVGSALGRYFAMLLIPWAPRLQLGDARAPEFGYAAFGALGLVGLGLVTFRYRGVWGGLSRQGRLPLVLGSVLTLVSLGLVLHIVPLSLGVVAADRFLYLPLIGLGLAIGPCAQRWTLIANVRRIRLAAATGWLILCSLLVSCYLRISDWCSEPRLWLIAYHHTPQTNPLPGNELGNLYYRAGLLPQAAAIFARTAANERYGDDTAAGNLANIWAQSGRYERARAKLEQLCARNSEVPKYCLDAGLVALHMFDLEAARRWISLALHRAPDYPSADAALEQVTLVESLLNSPEYHSSDPSTRLKTQFRVAELAGRRPEALELGRLLLSDPSAPLEIRRQAAEYWVRFGSPLELQSTLGPGSPVDEVVDDAIWTALTLRSQAAQELMATWTELGIPLAVDD